MKVRKNIYKKSSNLLIKERLNKKKKNRKKENKKKK